MIIRAIRLFNFGVYRGEHGIVTEPVGGFSRPLPITLIGGMNGTGKTSLRSAILLALYGRRSPGVGASAQRYPDELRRLANRNAPSEEGSWVELEFRVKVGVEDQILCVRRFWRTVNHETAEHLSVWRNGTPDGFLTSTWDHYVDELLPIGLASLFFFDGERIAAIAESEETAEIVKDAIRALLGLNLVDRAVADLDPVIRRNRALVRNAATRAKFSDLEEERDSLQVQIDQVHQDMAHVTSSILVTLSQIGSEEEQFVREGGQSAENRRQLEGALGVIDQGVQRDRAELVELCGGSLPLVLVRPQLGRLLDSAAAQEKAREARVALGVLMDRNTEVTQWVNSNSPRYPSSELTSLLRRQEEELRAAASRANHLPITSGGVSQLEGLVSTGLEDVASRARATMADERELSERRRLALWNLGREPSSDAIRLHLERLKDLSEKKGSLEQQQEQLRHRLGYLEGAMKQLERRASALANELVQADDADRVVLTALRSQDALREYRRRLTMAKSAALVTHIAEAFNQLTHKQTLVEDIRLDPEELRLTLVDSQGREFPKSALSSGERQMLAVSILWGLGRASGRELPIVIDSPMGRLDSSHRLNFVREYLPCASDQMIILSTDTEVVGPYLECLLPFISHTYLLLYDEVKEESRISSAYFTPREAVS